MSYCGSPSKGYKISKSNSALRKIRHCMILIYVALWFLFSLLPSLLASFPSIPYFLLFLISFAITNLSIYLSGIYVLWRGANVSSTFWELTGWVYEENRIGTIIEKRLMFYEQASHWTKCGKHIRSETVQDLHMGIWEVKFPKFLPVRHQIYLVTPFSI